MRYCLKGFIYLISLALGLTLAAACLLPTLLSTQKGNHWLCRELSQITGSEWKIQKLHLSLLGSQQIEGLQIKKSGEYTLAIERIDLPTPLWKLPLPFCKLGSWRIEKPSYQFFASALETTQEPADDSSKGAASFHPVIFFSRHLTLDILEGKLSCQNLDHSRSSEIYPLSLHLETQGETQSATFNLHGITGADHGKGELSLQATIENPTFLAQTLKLEFALKQFPLDILTPFLPKPYDALMRSWGEAPLQLQAQVVRQDTYGDYSLHIDSKPLQGDLKFKENNGSFTLLQPATFDLTLTANDLNLLLQSQQLGPRVTPQTPSFKTHLKLLDLDVDLKQLAHWSIDSEFTLSALALEHGAAKSYLGPINGSFSKYDLIHFKLNAKDPNSIGLDLDVTIGPTLAPQELVSFALSACRVQSADLAIWYPLPVDQLAWLFPASLDMQIKEQSKEFDFNLKGLMGACPLACHGSVDRHILSLDHLEAQIPSLRLPHVTANQLTLATDKLTCDLSDPFTTLDMKLDAHIKQLFIQNHPLTVDGIELQVKSQKGYFDHTLISSLVDSKGSWQLQNQKLKLLQPLEINLRATQKQLHDLVPHLPIAGNVELECRVDPNVWDTAANLQAQSFKVHTKIHGLSFQQAGQSTWKFADLSAQGSSNFGFDQLAFAMNASPLFSDHPACSLAVNGQWGTGGAHAKFNVTKLPTTLIDTVAAFGISSLLGKELNIDGNLIMQQGDKHLVANVDAAYLKAHAKLGQAANQNRWKLISPATLSWTLDSNGYEALDEFLTCQTTDQGMPGSKKNILSLAKPTHLTLELSRLDISESEPLLSLAGSMKLDSFQLIETTTQRTSSLEHFILNFEQDDSTDTLQAQATAGMAVKSDSIDQQGPLALGLKLKDFPTDASIEKSLLERVQLDIELACKVLPSDFFDLGLRWSGKSQLLSGMTLEQLIGPSADLQLTSHLKAKAGPFAIHLKSPYTLFDLDATLTDGVMTLKQPMKAQLSISPDLSTYLSQTMGISAKEGNPPFSIQISEKGFSLPVLPMNPIGINLAKGHLEIGQLEVPNKGNVNLCLTLLRAPKASSSKTANLWFTPIDFSIDKGIAQIERIDILAAEAFPLAFWGQVDMPQSMAHLCLGISGNAFERALALSHLPENYMMLFPIEGPFATAGIDMKIGAAKITSLLAMKNQLLAGILSLNPAAKLVVGALQSQVPIPDAHAKVPPSRYPLPWPEATKEPPHDEETN